VRRWNQGRLPAKYYAGLVTAPVRRTPHVWGFEKSGAGTSVRAGGTEAFLSDQKARGFEQRMEHKQERKRHAAEQREALDELLPRASGRDAIIENKLARREETRARDASPDRAFIPGGGGDMLGGDDSFAAAKAREARSKAMHNSRHMVKREALMARVADEQAKEDAKMAQFRALLGQGPITIAKRG